MSDLPLKMPFEREPSAGTQSSDSLVERVARAIEEPFLPHGYELKPHLLKAAARAAIASTDTTARVYRDALEPFAAFADLSGASYLPDDHVITLGSGMAARQLTMGDCRKARAALKSGA